MKMRPAILAPTRECLCWAFFNFVVNFDHS